MKEQYLIFTIDGITGSISITSENVLGRMNKFESFQEAKLFMIRPDNEDLFSEIFAYTIFPIFTKE